MRDDIAGGPFREADSALRKLNTILSNAMRQGHIELEIDPPDNEFIKTFISKPLKIRINLPVDP